MNLGTMVAIGATLLGTFGGGSGESASTSGSGGTSDALGFIKKGAKAFNLMRQKVHLYQHPSFLRTELKM